MPSSTQTGAPIMRTPVEGYLDAEMNQQSLGVVGTDSAFHADSRSRLDTFVATVVRAVVEAVCDTKAPLFSFNRGRSWVHADAGAMTDGQAAFGWVS